MKGRKHHGVEMTDVCPNDASVVHSLKALRNQNCTGLKYTYLKKGLSGSGLFNMWRFNLMFGLSLFLYIITLVIICLNQRYYGYICISLFLTISAVIVKSKDRKMTVLNRNIQ